MTVEPCILEIILLCGSLSIFVQFSLSNNKVALMRKSDAIKNNLFVVTLDQKATESVQKESVNAGKY